MTDQTELSEILMRYLSAIAAKQYGMKMTNDNIGIMNIQFDLAYEDVYGFHPLDGGS